MSKDNYIVTKADEDFVTELCTDINKVISKYETKSERFKFLTVITLSGMFLKSMPCLTEKECAITTEVVIAELLSAAFSDFAQAQQPRH